MAQVEPEPATSGVAHGRLRPQEGAEMQDDQFLPLAAGLAGFVLLGCGGVTTAPEHPTVIGEAARVEALEVGDHHGRFTESDEQLELSSWVKHLKITRV